MFIPHVPQLTPSLMVLGHGLGDAGDLPVPFDTVVLLAGVAVLGVAALVTSRARPARPAPSSVLTGPESRLVQGVLRAVTVVGLLALLTLAIAGPNDPTVNPVPRLVYGVFWPTLLLSSVLFGGWWRSANPLRALGDGLARVTGDPDDEFVTELPPRLGLWPAAALLFVFVWGSVALTPRPQTVVFLVGIVGATVLAGSLRYGRGFVEHADPFEAYTSVLALLSPLCRAPDGRLRWRSPRPALAGWTAPPGLLAVFAVAIGADTFDGVLQLLAWQNLKVGLPGWTRALIDTAGMAACVGLAYGLGWIATRRARDLLPAFVPVAAAYTGAHYLAVAPIDAQVAFRQLSDPVGRGWNLLGLTTSGASYDIVPGLVAALTVLGVLLAGHLAAVVVANDLAMRSRQPRAARAVQVPLRAVLVASILVSVLVRFGAG